MTDTIKPATDDQIDKWTKELDDCAFVILDGVHFLALIARIRAEQAEKEEALQTTNMATYLAARHNAILECAEIAKEHSVLAWASILSLQTGEEQ